MSPTIARRRRYVTNFWMISPAMRVLSRKKSSANRSTGIRIRPASCLDRLGNQFDGIAVAPQVLPIRRAREHAYAMQIVGGCGHRIRWLSRRWFREHQGHYTSGLRCSHVRRCGWRAVLAPSLEDQKATLRIVLKFG